MKVSTQIALCFVWILVVFYLTSRPPPTPPLFADQSNVLGPTRSPYNPAFAAALDQGLRDFWQKPDQVLEKLGDLNGMTVADIGCGEGYFTLRLLESVGPDGKVYANDIQPEMLETLSERIPEDWRDRIELVLGTAEDTGIPALVDVVFVIQVLGEVPDQKGFLDQIRALMDENSRLVLIDSKHITDPASGFTRPLNPRRLIRVLDAAGFIFAPGYEPDDFDFLPKQFFFVLTLKDPGR